MSNEEPALSSHETPIQKFNLTPEEAIAEMEVQLAKMRAEIDRHQLKDISSDDAYELGYETALFDYRHLTGPNPRETGTVVFEKDDEGNAIAIRTPDQEPRA